MTRLFILGLLLAPIIASATNAGIVRGLWYDAEEFFADEPVRIYIAIRNNTGADLSGTVEFFVNDTQIERKNIEALDGRVIESWADWNPVYGTSSITATLSRTEISSTASGTQAIEVVSAVAEDTIFVDRDTDNDGTGDYEDTDDDGDGLSDLEEQAAGTDPLVFNEPVTETNTDNSEGDNPASTSESSSSSENGGNQTTNSPEPVGLEQYLTPSPADTAFSSLTSAINESKKRLDQYRDERNIRLTPNVELDVAVNDDGFGRIERVSQAEREQSQVEKPDGWLGAALEWLSNLFSVVFTIVLAATSYSLSYPMAIQVFLLLFILYLLYRVAKKFGERNQ